MNQNSFNWDCTNRELVVYIPNFARKHLLIPTLKRFKTNISNDRWLFVIVNDRREEDLSDLESEFNIKWFTFEHKNQNEMNGCLLRNFIIKRCQSKWLMTRDPEICLEGDDIISKVIDLEDVVYRPKFMIELCEQETQKILDNPLLDLTKLSVLRSWTVTNKNYEAFHNGCCMRTQRLKDIRGYEEELRHGYGYDDVNLLERLKLSGVEFVVDDKVTGFHIHHPIIRKFHRTILSNETIYKRLKQNLQIVANKNVEWGEHLGG